MWRVSRARCAQAGLDDIPAFLEIIYPFELADETVLASITSSVMHCRREYAGEKTGEEADRMKQMRIPLLISALLAVGLHAEPIKLHPDNPHYYLFHGKPTILITSAEHYGGVVNKDFDYVAYFDALKAYGLNYTRIYPGFLFEPMGKFMKGNTLGAKPISLTLPWARSQKPGYALGGNLFDLDKWDPAFFARLKDFVAKAAERGIVVEICFYNAQYGDTWPMSPLYYENNIQGEGRCDYEDAQTLKHADVVRREDDYVRKITQEVNEFDNVILEICDEPYLTGTPIELAGPWIAHNVEVIKKTESTLPQEASDRAADRGTHGRPVRFHRASRCFRHHHAVRLGGKPRADGRPDGSRLRIRQEQAHRLQRDRLLSNLVSGRPRRRFARGGLGVRGRRRRQFQPTERALHGSRPRRQDRRERATAAARSKACTISCTASTSSRCARTRASSRAACRSALTRAA